MQFLSLILLILEATEQNREKVAQFKPPNPLPVWINPGLAVSIERKVFTHDAFDRVAEDVQCENAELVMNKRSMNFLDCKQRCIQSESCSHFAYWNKEKKCEAYVDCPSVGPDEDKKIQLWMRYTTCDLAISYAYLRLLEQAFTKGTVVITSEKDKNMQCSCMTAQWMICAIFIDLDSEDGRQQYIAKQVMEKLNRDDPRALRPFAIMPSDLKHVIPPIVYRGAFENDDLIYSEIMTVPTSRCLHLNICIMGTPGGICPLLGTAMGSGEAVYILKSEEKIVASGKPVVCLSAAGVRITATADMDNMGFIDPLGREGGRRLFLKDDYEIYFLFDDEDLATGICKDNAIMLEQKKKRRGGGKKKKSFGAQEEPSTPSSSNEGAGPSSSVSFPDLQGASEIVESEGDLSPVLRSPTPQESSGQLLSQVVELNTDPRPAVSLEIRNPSDKLSRKLPPQDVSFSPLPYLAPKIEEGGKSSKGEASSSTDFSRAPVEEPPVIVEDKTVNVDHGGWIEIGPGGKKTKAIPDLDSSRQKGRNDEDDVLNQALESSHVGEPVVSPIEGGERLSSLKWVSKPLNPDAPEWFPQAYFSAIPRRFLPLPPGSYYPPLPQGKSPPKRQAKSNEHQEYSFNVKSHTAPRMQEPSAAEKVPPPRNYVSKGEIPDVSRDQRIQSTYNLNTISNFFIFIIIFTSLASFCSFKNYVSNFGNQNIFIDFELNQSLI